MTKQKYYITTAIAYTSGKPHIGNIYEIVLADSIARYRRQEGYDVYFMTGTDEHGQKIEEKARAAGKTPQVFVDEVAGVIRGLFDLMNTSYDKFIRTTDPYHELQVQKIFKRLYEQGDIYKDIYEGWYCTPCESFYTDTQLVDGKCPDCGGDVHRAKEESYFFKLSNYTDRLVKYIEDNPSFIQPESRKNEMMNNFIKPGLQDLCVSRTSFKWGIPVTFDPDHVVYVWIDALSNYITGIGYDVDGNHGEIFKKYWPADVHLIGKDILRFHTIYWPIMLMALGIELPKQVFGHPWLLVGEGKMSKSKGNVIYADDLVGLFGVDAVRYLMLHEMPFAQDGTLTYDLMVERINTDLANILGNLVNRTLTMTNKYFNGVVNNPRSNAHPDQELIDLALETVKKADAHMENLRVQDAIDDVLDLLRRSNKYIDETQPWVIARTPEDLPRLQTVIYNLLEAIRFAAVLLESFIPETSKSILDQLNTAQRDKQSLSSFGNLEENTKVTQKPTILFARLDPKEVFEKLTPAPKKLETKPEITIEDFAKIDLRVGKILSCQKHPSAEKLLVSQVQVGPEVRQIVSGIATHFTPESLIGKKVIVVANLKAAKLRGELSQGMLLVGEEGETLEILSVDTLSEGSIVR
ncbi:MAG: methionine--tRNA ligase [Firmicutes bacterium GWF2_51_9]|nr:MAG: methionine--tRNA ligase [Firmicutes bacterium GWF2_51_9]OGS57351.1 MAG: methionine--tRNA ligase [Firmicutes bacterium GWE2_51_13]HAM62955.1 methionine--tRNA ligase [Erysipelotrichaceae bacterium]HBZ41465.1 methionine--tRNA ligase [Erysipelotrichaceae bacterium]